MLLKCCLFHRDIALPRHAIFTIFVSIFTIYVYVLICMSYLCNLFAIIIFIFITTDHMIRLIQTNLLFLGYVCQKFSLRLLLSFCLIFCEFQPCFAYKCVAGKKKPVYKWNSKCCEINIPWIRRKFYFYFQ